MLKITQEAKNVLEYIRETNKLEELIQTKKQFEIMIYDMPDHEDTRIINETALIFRAFTARIEELKQPENGDKGA